MSETLFTELYCKELVRVRASRPEEYNWPELMLSYVADIMLASMKRGSANLNSVAIRATCSKLKIKHNRAAIMAALTDESKPQESFNAI